MSRPPSSNAEALRQAAAALRTGDAVQAEALAGRVLKAERRNRDAAQVLAAALMAQGRHPEAVDALGTLARRLGEPELYLMLGRALAMAGRREDALRAMRHATDCRPALAAAFLELGMTLIDLGRWDEAEEVLRAGCELTPVEAGLHVALGHVSLNRYDRRSARARFETALAQEPDRPDALAGLAKLTAADGDPVAAAELYGRALRLRPGNVDLMLDQARCLLNAGNRAAGERLARAAVTAAPQLAGRALKTLADTAHGRVFLRPSLARAFLRDQAR